MGLRYKYIIISDLHLGSRVSESEQIISFLENIETENLIINGDLIDKNHAKRLNKRDWKILSILRKMSKNTDIYWIEGNHDSEFCPILSDLLGFEHKKEMNIKIGSNRIHIQHGDKFDYWTKTQWVLTEIATGIYYIIQLSDRKKKFVYWIKKKSKQWLKVTKSLEKKVFDFAIKHKFNTIILSHSHFSDKIEKNGILYVNSGSFCEPECYYVTIDNEGKVELKELEN